MTQEWHRGGYYISTDKSRLDLAVIHNFLTTSYWAAGIPHRRQGLSKWLMQVIADHAELQGLRRWVLLTRDAHGLYRKTGFMEPVNPERYMEKIFPDVYKNGEM